MGNVYKARDSRLGRTVAIKVVSDGRDGKEFQQRLRKEAKAASALTHQNIVGIYDVLGLEQGEAIVMEYVDGQSLRQALQKKTISSDQAIEAVAQVASALAAAHRLGIVHRDIKPENIVVTATNQAKVLDFGIARRLQAHHEASENVATETVEHRTDVGVIMGTPFYMSPEQAAGRSVDWRTDIFSLGVVLYEVLSGKRPFSGTNTLDILHAVIHQTPPPLDRNEFQDILEKALAKDPEERYQSAADLALDLRRLKKIQIAKPAAPVSQKHSVLFPILLLLLAVLAGYIFYHRLTHSSQEAPVNDVQLRPIITDEGYEGEASFFPDGETIAYVSDRTGNFDIFMRQVSGGPDVNLTNDPSDDVQPSVSRDGRWIAFVSTRQSSQGLIYPNPNSSLKGGDIWIMPALGGTPRKIVSDGNFPSWSKDGKHLIYAAGHWLNPQICRVASAGGVPEKIPIDFSKLNPPPLFVHRPLYSPNGKWILFEGNADAVVYAPSAGGVAKKIGAGRSPTWNRDGSSILFASNESGRNYGLQQIAFDADGGTTGASVPVTIGRGADFHPAVSPTNGNIAFSATDRTFNLERIDFSDAPVTIETRPQQITFGNNINWFFDSSPDGNEVVYQSLRGGKFDIWKTRINGPTVQLTSDPEFNDRQPKWSPDGRWIAFMRSRRDSNLQSTKLMIMSQDGANPTTLLENAGAFLTWMPNSKDLLFFEKNGIHLVNIETKKRRTITKEEVRNVHNISADGSWLAYGVMQNGATDLRAMPFAGGTPISVVTSPHDEGHVFFSLDSKWIYYQQDHKNVFRVPGPAQNWKKAPPVQVTFFPESGLYLEDVQRTRDGKFLLYSRGRIQSDIWLLSKSAKAGNNRTN